LVGRDGELLVDIYRPHSGGSSFQYLINSIKELKDLIQRETWAEIDITIFRENPYSLRGMVNEETLERALSLVKDGEWYSILSLKKDFPNPIDFLNTGNSHSELQADFSRFSGQEIRFGQNPFDLDSDRAVLNDRNKIFKLLVTRNQGYYENCAKNPEKYRWLEKLWLE
jgi:hypothetical protein